ncbi:succinate dehydrogenase, cytochrome b556 subunit [Orientia chuto str. Dubai]|uniref:Succinate dehydrogenase cytochrome b556 subunit n=1 Tax=Orientia chuto str. Dubai TaxID=1359168 RepID=A0A0F3MKS9_9RICK|nr:succinate dehydrogenase, cytochrome b556 subunit [Candidatus Orientia mediorientalis]KJV56355.1 succinate dehydrogenase, cytochrome b556 subunit [Orientia chuto str. Dubai]
MSNNLSVRPTSPHVTIYHMQMSMILSILHRISGIAVFGGASIVTWWLILCVYSDFNNDIVDIFYNIWFQILLYLVVFATCFHLCTGIRHLIWSTGYGFSIKYINISGLIAVILSIIIFYMCIS